MAEKFVLPDPAPKGAEHEKWKAMVDSVIEFIAASRTMLQVLNDRVKDNEKLRLEDAKKLEEEKVKLEFYEEFLNSTINNKPVTKKAVVFPNKNQDSGDTEMEKEKEETCFLCERSNDNILKRSGKHVSRIPKTRSYVEDRSKSVRVERTQNEGTPYKSRRASEIGYSTIHQRTKAPRGDAVS